MPKAKLKLEKSLIKKIKVAANRRDKIILKLHDLNQTYQSL